ncbi:hypothetical protein [Streptomyces sp. NPDC006446]|uniref:hypothetical protein n=1 Tax=Streptomyces sp. NPDC006446 TaxID=3154301 RepID=UPI0033A6D5D6
MRRRGWGAAVLAVAALSGTLVVQGAARGKTATVDLRSTTTKYRDAIWATTWTASAKHT